MAGRFHSKNLQIDPITTKALLKDCIYLEDSSYDLKGYKVYGSPFTPVYHDWAFMLERGKPLEHKWQ